MCPLPPSSCSCSPKKNPFQGCVSHLFLPYLVLSSPSPRAENGRNSSKVLLPTFKSPLIFSLSSVRPLHVLEMEESVAKSSFPLSDHPQSFLCHRSDLSTCWKWKNQQQSPPSHFRLSLNLFSIIGQPSPRVGNGRINNNILFPTFGSSSILFNNPSDLPLMVHFFHFLFFSLSIFFPGQRDSFLPKKKLVNPLTFHSKMLDISLPRVALSIFPKPFVPSPQLNIFFFPYVLKLSFPKPSITSPQLSIFSR